MTCRTHLTRVFEPVEGRVYDNLSKYLKSHGASFDAVNLDNVVTHADSSELDHGVLANRTIVPGEIVFSLPTSLILGPKESWEACYNAAMSHEKDANAAEREVRSFDARDRLSLLLIWERSLMERGQTVKHEAYIAALPNSFNDPCWWTVEERQALLNGTALLAAVEARVEQYSEAYSKLATMPWIQKWLGTDFTWDTYGWARSVIASRSFPAWLLQGQRPGSAITGAADKVNKEQIQVTNSNTIHQGVNLESDFFQGPILLPGIDMINHQRGLAVIWCAHYLESNQNSDAVADEIHLISGVITECGNQVFNNYGAKPNDELLLGYGFCIFGNPSDSFAVRLHAAPEEDDDLWRLRQQKMSRIHGESSSVPDVRLTYEEPLPLLLVQIMQIMTATRWELMQDLDTFRNELAAIAELKKLIISRRERLLETQPAMSSKFNHSSFQSAMIYRQGQIQVLDVAIAAVDARIRSILCSKMKEDNSDVALSRLYEKCPLSIKLLSKNESVSKLWQNVTEMYGEEELDENLSLIVAVLHSYFTSGYSELDQTSINDNDLDQSYDLAEDLKDFFEEYEHPSFHRLVTQAMIHVEQYSCCVYDDFLIIPI